MKKLLAVLLLSLAALSGGCQSVGCTIQGGVDTVLAPVIANGLQCTNQAAVLASLQSAGQTAGLCTTTATTPTLGVPTVLCQSLADALLNVLAGAAIPSAWGCSPSAAVSTLTTLVNNACANLGVPAPKAAH